MGGVRLTTRQHLGVMKTVLKYWTGGNTAIKSQQTAVKMGTLYINHTSRKLVLNAGREDRRLTLIKGVGSPPNQDKDILKV